MDDKKKADAGKPVPPVTDEIVNGILDGVKYTAEDFLNTTKPYEAVYSYSNIPFQEDRMENRMTDVAKALGVSGFKKSYQAYKKSLKLARDSADISDNITQFDQQGDELRTGDWTADETGVWRYGSFGAYEIACTHPIVPVQRLKNIDTGELKVKLRFRRGDKSKRPWTEIVEGFDTLSNAKNIVSLSRIGISVTSGKRAQNLVDYIADVMDLNYDTIPEINSVSRMGWNEEGFSPYVEGVVFDGNPGYANIFKAIRQQGDYGVWKEKMREVRAYSLTARIVLAASFAAPLIKPLGLLPFFLHLWGIDSGTGKTVSQMAAVSVWGDPSIGGPLFPNFNSTSVAPEIMAGFLNNIPVCIDELQLAKKDGKGKPFFNVYELAAGSGRLRSNTQLGLRATPTWATCFITSGESTIVGDNDGAGAANRVIEIECKADDKVIDNGRETADIVRKNFGHAGREFVEYLCKEEHAQLAATLYSAYFDECVKSNTTEKQALAAAIILTADCLATQWIFEGAEPMTVGQMDEFLKSREQVSAGVRGYNFMCDWVAQNANKMRPGEGQQGEIYGLVEGSKAHIIRSVFNKACDDAGISAKALLSYMKTRELIETRGRAMTKAKKINGVPVECVVMKLPVEDADDAGFVQGKWEKIEKEELPF